MKRIAIAAFAAALVSQPASALDEDDHSAVRALLTTGVFKPLGEVLASIEERYSGWVVEAELEEEDDAPRGWVYNVEILTADGAVEIEVDPESGEVIDEESDDDLGRRL